MFAVQESGRWRVESLRLDNGERHAVLADATMPIFGPGGYLFFYRANQLQAVPFDVFLMVKDEATAGRLRMILNWSPGPAR